MTEVLAELSDLSEKIKLCRLCRLCEGATNAVPGEGSYEADIMFIGEAPGKDEDLQGRPFVGRAGQYLNMMIESIGLKREDVFITNVVKHRPPGNRDPLPDEVEACFPYLVEQVRIIKPKLICTLGRHAMDRFLPGLKISQAHGKAVRYKGIYSETQVYFPLYHPAAALHNPNLKDTLIYDMKKIPILLKKI